MREREEQVVMSPSFNFSLGSEVQDGARRWVNGSVESRVGGYDFRADLMRRYGSGVLQCHTVRLAVPRPFHADDFAAYLRFVSRGEFDTVTHVLGLYETEGLDPTSAAAIFQATANWVEPWDHDSLALLQELTGLGAQLQEVRRKEVLGFAFSQFGARAC